MDLFIVNRHLDVPIPNPEDDEKTKLEITLKKIEKNRERFKTLKENKICKLITRRELIEKKYRQKQLKREVPVFSTNFIDENISDIAQDYLLLDKTDSEKQTQKPEVKEVESTQKNKRKWKSDEEKIEGFTILGSDDFKKKSHAKQVLPEWLANPTIISVDLQNLSTRVKDLKVLSKDIRNQLRLEGVKYFFPVQAEVIPYLLKSIELHDCIAPHDVCVSAPTGSGKTLTFVLPIIQALQGYTVKQIRALVLLPTQDLAVQVYNTFLKYVACTNLKVLLMRGSACFLQEQNQLVTKNVAFGYLSKVDIIVCTAGRLVDHLKQTKGFTLEHLQFLVIDEADRVLEDVQNDWLYHLERHIFKNDTSDLNVLTLDNYRSRRAPQKLLFSATLSQDPEKLHKLGLFQPKLFTSVIGGDTTPKEDGDDIADHFVGKYTTPKELTEKYILSSMNLKPLVLYQFIKNESLTKTLVFVHAKETAHRLKVLLQSLLGDGKKVEEIGAMINAQQRNKLIQSFTDNEIDILISTDAFARGIDLPGVKCVISYNAPKYIKNYIHRAGRTARAGEQGLAVTMLNDNQLNKFNEMLAQGNKSPFEAIHIDEELLEPLGKQYQEALAALKEAIHTEDVRKNKKIAEVKKQFAKHSKSN